MSQHRGSARIVIITSIPSTSGFHLPARNHYNTVNNSDENTHIKKSQLSFQILNGSGNTQDGVVDTLTVDTLTKAWTSH